MIRALRRDELEAAGALVAAAFREDPGFRFILPDDARRRRRLPALFTASLRIDFDAGALLRGAFDGDALAGVSSRRPAGLERSGLFSWLRHLPELWWLYLDPGMLLRGVLVARAIEPLRPADRAYLHVLAVHPACHGRGVGAALLKEALAAGPLHLETFEPANRRYYAARGLTETAEVRPAAIPPFWTFRGGKGTGLLG
jgi:ribosomal protein S18 acetylase RimI-like enzyme